MKSPLFLVCGLAFACAASAQPLGSNQAGSMSQSGAANVGAGAPPPFPGGGQMSGSDFRVQNRLPPNAVPPSQARPEAKPVEEKPAPAKPEPKPEAKPGS